MSVGSEVLDRRSRTPDRVSGNSGVAPPKSGQFQPGRSGNIKGPRPGQLQKWTLPVLEKLAKHHPEAIRRIGAIVKDAQHKDHFQACKFVCETLIRDSYSKYNTPDRGEVVVRIEMATERIEKVVPALDIETVQIAADEIRKEQHEEAKPEEATT